MQTVGNARGTFRDSVGPARRLLQLSRRERVASSTDATDLLLDAKMLFAFKMMVLGKSRGR